MDDIFIKFRYKFIGEALSLLDGIEKALLELENNPSDKNLIQEIFRVMHTLKGVGAMYGYASISNLTHKLETVYEHIRDNNILLSQKMADCTLKAIDHIKNLLEDENLLKKENQIIHQNLVDEIESVYNSFSKHSVDTESNSVKVTKEHHQTEKSYYIMLLPDESFIQRGINIVEILRDLSHLGTYHIVKHQFAGFPGIDTTNENAWGIYFCSDADLPDIQSVFIFIEDNVKIIKIANQNIFHNHTQFLNKTSDNKDDVELLCDDADGAFGFFVNEIIKTNKNIIDIVENKTIPQQKENINSKSDVSQTDSNITQPSALPHIQSSARISVEAAKLDQLMFLVSELVTTNAQLNLACKIRNQLQIDTAAEKIEKLSKQFRENAINLRLVPIDDIVVRFQRLIRDLSHSLNKEIRFVAEGTDTELDKSIIDMLVEPFMHIIRNSIDHGIETPEKRVQIGKSSEGIIKLSAYYSGTYVYIKISDDGKGINTDLILKKAIEKGFAAPEAKLTRKEIFDLIFLPGFSTAESLTQVSGRGVGMDVVRKKISEVRGEVFVESEVGVGTTFTIRLQQTVSIIDGLLIKAHNTYFMLPLSDVEVCDERKHSEIFMNQNKLIEYQKSMLPFIHLRSEFGLDTGFPNTEKIIIINRNEERLAIIADNIIGEQQAVLKPLGKMFKNQEFLLGASIMGDGNLAIMLDITKLAEKLLNK